MSGGAPLRVRWLGRVPYREALAVQQALFERGSEQHLLLLEHDPVLTLGRHANPANVLASDDEPEAMIAFASIPSVRHALVQTPLSGGSSHSDLPICAPVRTKSRHLQPDSFFPNSVIEHRAGGYD